MKWFKGLWSNITAVKNYWSTVFIPKVTIWRENTSLRIGKWFKKIKTRILSWFKKEETEETAIIEGLKVGRIVYTCLFALFFYLIAFSDYSVWNVSLPVINFSLLNFSWFIWLIIAIIAGLLLYYRKDLHIGRFLRNMPGDLFRYAFFSFLFFCALLYISGRIFENVKVSWNTGSKKSSVENNSSRVSTVEYNTTTTSTDQVAIPIIEGNNHLEVGKQYYYFRDSRKLDVFLLEDTTVTFHYYKEDDPSISWKVTNVRTNGEPHVYFDGAPTNDVGRFIVTTDKTIDVTIKRYR